MLESVLAVIFKKTKYLILHRKLNWSGWEMLKGGVEEGEKLEDALMREIKEETGLTNVYIITKLPHKITYIKNNEKVHQHVFLVRCIDEKIKLSHEHDDFQWSEYQEALGLLTHNNQKESLKIANHFLVNS